MSVNEATKKGHLMLTLPGMTILFGLMFGLMVLSIYKIIPGYWGFLCFPVSFISAILFACLRMVKWRIWAFSNVDKSDWEELRAQAVDGGLIGKKGSLIEKIEIRSKADQARINEFETNEVQESKEQEFEDDLSIPDESEFKFSKGVLYVSLVRNLIIASLGIYLVSNNPTSYFYYIFPAIGILLSIKPVIKLRQKKTPVVILNTVGIGVDNSSFKWDYMSEETAKMSGVGENRTSYIFFNYRGEDKQIDLSSYEVTLPELRKLLKIYRHRNKAVNIV